VVVLSLDEALVSSLFLFVEAAAAALGEAGSRLTRSQSEMRMNWPSSRGQAVLEEAHVQAFSDTILE
jgi:hypothetical protein